MILEILMIIMILVMGVSCCVVIQQTFFLASLSKDEEEDQWEIWENTESQKDKIKTQQDELEGDNWYPFIVVYRNINKEHSAQYFGDKCPLLYDLARYNFEDDCWTLKMYANSSVRPITIIKAYTKLQCYSQSDMG